MAPAISVEERETLDDYERGYVDGLWAYAWWKDGVAYVGSTGTTYELAVDRFLRESGRRGQDYEQIRKEREDFHRRLA